jgi:hydroxyethylthiazole kinase-like uncharacterized protein yjeF
MTEILTSAQMRAAEAAAIDSGAVTGLDLMERAGQGVLAAIGARWPDLFSQRGIARILCGPGNNGGDGFVIGRLMQAAGWQVETVFFGRADRLPPDARQNLDRLAWPVVDGHATAPTQSKPDLSVDAVLGTGLTRPIADQRLQGWLRLHDQFTLSGGATVAVDIPSGLDADSGRVLVGPLGACCARSCLTVTFHRAKPGHYLADGPEYCGALDIMDIGL